MIYWIIGQSCSGKTTLAKLFHAQGTNLLYLDGDDLRKIFGNSYSPAHFTREYREEQTKCLQRFVAHISDQGFIVVVATVNPYRDIREQFKRSRDDVTEIYIHKTDARQREHFAVVDYEEPLTDFIDINTTGHTPEESLRELLRKISRRA